MDLLSGAYWPWWFGAGMFATLVVGIWLAERRMLGVSGSFAAAIERRREEDEALQALADSSAEEVDEAMLRATLAAFGPDALAEYERDHTPSPAAAAPVMPRSVMPRSAHLTFLAMLVVGGFLGAVASGSWHPVWSLGPSHVALFGDGIGSSLSLLAGGFLVGFGTRMAGGCTSGHGLSGCAGLRPGSLVATACFFGAAVGVSLLLGAL